MNDQSTVRLVIGVLGLLAFTVVAGGIVLAITDRSIPEALIAMGAAAAGAVGSILARTGSSEPTPVVGAHGGPVVVEEVTERGQSIVTVLIVVLVVFLVVALLGAV